MTRRIALIAALLVAGGLAAGCGERPQVIDYKQGTYQGKPDTRPWESAPFNGDKVAWENALKQRNQGQNEYRRVN